VTAFVLDFQRQRLAVACDTLAYLPSRDDVKPLGYVTKVNQLPHLRAVLFCRGQLQIAAWAALWIGLDPGIQTLEQAAEALPDVLADCTLKYSDEQRIDNPDDLGLCEAVLAGWSEAEQRCRLWYFLNTDRYVAQEDGGHHYGLLTMPRLGERDMPAGGRTGDKMLIACMHAEQMVFAREREAMGGVRLGGEVQKWTISRDGISQTVIHRFADYAETLHAGAAITARIKRGDEIVNVADGLVPVGDMKRADEIEPPTREMSRNQRKAARRAQKAA
jgi:hypothetical protein